MPSERVTVIDSIMALLIIIIIILEPSQHGYLMNERLGSANLFKCNLIAIFHLFNGGSESRSINIQSPTKPVDVRGQRMDHLA